MSTRGLVFWTILVIALAAPALTLAKPVFADDLKPGDIAIILYNADGEDNIVFVALVDIGEGTEIKFTDNGWKSTGEFRTGEGVNTWTAPAGGITAGTTVNFVTSGSLNFYAEGDQILAYQGLDSSPSFVYALNNEGAHIWQSDATSTSTSALPTGLTNGSTAVALNEIDNAVYDCSISSGTKAELLAAISNYENWSGSDSERQTTSCTFTPTAITLSSFTARPIASQGSFFHWQWLAMAGAVGLVFGGVAAARRLLKRQRDGPTTVTVKRIWHLYAIAKRPKRV